MTAKALKIVRRPVSQRLKAPLPLKGAVIGWLAGFEPERGLLVDFTGNRAGPVLARSILPLDAEVARKAAEERRQAVLLFENDDPRAPIVVGLLQPAPLQQVELRQVNEPPQEAHVDGRRIVLEGQDEIVLQCGQASITLRRNGRVVIKGTHVVSHSTGVNRIRGGSVQIN